MDENVMKLNKELIQIAASFPTDNDGEKHGYINLMNRDSNYVQLLKRMHCSFAQITLVLTMPMLSKMLVLEQEKAEHTSGLNELIIFVVVHKEQG